MKRARLFVGLLMLITSSLAPAALITLAAELSGPAEFPPNASPGTGLAIVQYDSVLHTLRVEANFSGSPAPRQLRISTAAPLSHSLERPE